MKYLICLLSLFLLAGCIENPDPGGSGDSLGFSPSITYSNNRSQSLIIIPYDGVRAWFLSNKDIKIISIDGTGQGGHGVNTFFIILYETPERAPEKTIKEQALEKLSDKEKEALGVR